MGWVIGFLLLFIIVLTLTARNNKEYNDDLPVPALPRTSATLSVVTRAGVPYAILPDGTHAKISFSQRGLLGTGSIQGMQQIYLGGGVVKMPVRLTRGGQEASIGVLRHADKSVRTVVVDMGTRQLHMRTDSILGPKEGVPYYFTTEGAVELRGESNRLGSVALGIDNIESTGYPGQVRCAGGGIQLRRTVPSGNKTVIGSHDIVKGNHRLIFDLVNRRVLVQ